MQNQTHTRHLYWLWLTGLIIIADQISKYFALHNLSYEQPIVLLPWLNLILAYNTGAAFSLLKHAGGWQQWLFGGIAVVVSIVILVWLYRLRSRDIWTALGLSLILGGAIGNLIDRIHHGFVVDFIDFHVGHWHWPVFNFADSAVCVGALILILAVFFKKSDKVQMDDVKQG